jgi:hypothetical protein
MIFLASKTLLYPLRTGEENFFSTLNIMILQMVKNGSVRFSGHVDVQVSYKILWSKSTKEGPNCVQYALLSREGCFEAILDST